MNSYSRDKIKPIVDIPLTFMLEQVNGQEAPSKFTGIEYRFSVVHDNRPAYLYLPSEGRDAIHRVEPEPGDTIELVKQKSGNRIYFRAELLGDGQEPPPPARRTARPPAPQAAPRPGYHNPEDSFPDEPPRTRQAAPRRQIAAAPAPQRSNGNGTTAHGQAQPPRPEATDVHPFTQRVAGCLKVSYDAWVELENYAKEKGREVNYTSEDVRATALTIYINLTNGRGK